MPDPIPNPSAATTPPAGTGTPAPTGGQPAQPTPAAEPKPGATATPTPAPGTGTPVIPASVTATPTPAAKPGATPTPGVKPEPVPTGTVPITALHEERTKRQTLETEVQQLRDMVQQRGYQQQAQQEAQPNQMQKEIEQLWDTDPRKAVQAEIMVAMNWRDSVEANLSAQATDLSGKYTDFNTYRSQAETYVRSLPLDQRSDPRVMEVAYLVVRGQNVDQIMETQKNELYQKFQSGEFAGTTPAPGTFTAPVATGTVQLSQDQMNAATAMGLTPEAYASAIQVPK